MFILHILVQVEPVKLPKATVLNNYFFRMPIEDFVWQVPRHGFISAGRVLRPALVVLKSVMPLNLRVAGPSTISHAVLVHLMFLFLNLTFSLCIGNMSYHVQVCRNAPGKKKNGATRFTGSRVFRSWSTISRGLKGFFLATL